jgi:hypothetical protein
VNIRVCGHSALPFTGLQITTLRSSLWKQSDLEYFIAQVATQYSVLKWKYFASWYNKRSCIECRLTLIPGCKPFNSCVPVWRGGVAQCTDWLHAMKPEFFSRLRQILSPSQCPESAVHPTFCSFASKLSLVPQVAWQQKPKDHSRPSGAEGRMRWTTPTCPPPPPYTLTWR